MEKLETKIAENLRGIYYSCDKSQRVVISPKTPPFEGYMAMMVNQEERIVRIGHFDCANDAMAWARKVISTVNKNNKTCQ